ncbi:hypothetical protein GCM10010464_69600 [Pseudonocardia yunnanensis]|uniref:NlpC/P60 family protein n=1 Tax=Pseudonocardia yunnanensis TaxID=58107 RepID=A0ABW4F157_9PSEU
MTNERHRIPRWPAVAAAVLALVGVVLVSLPAQDVVAAPAAVEDAVQAQVTAPVRPASFGRKFGGANPGRTGPIVLGLTIADLGDPATVAVPTAAQPPAARIPDVPRITTTAKPGTAAAVAIAFALVQRGLPYVWGGDGPLSGEAGFDCSGLTTAAYDWAGISLPRTAHTQYYAGPHVPADAPLEPGDLVFYGVPERVHHVGLYLGNGRMINAPTFGKPVRTAFVRYPGDDYLGATRPAAGRDAPGLLEAPDLPFDVPPEPAPDAPPGPAEFPAPPAPDDVPATPAPGTQAPTPSTIVAAPAPGAPTSAAAPDGSVSQPPPTGPAATGSAAQPPRGPAAQQGTAAGATATSGSAPPAGPPSGDAATRPPTADRAGAPTARPSEPTPPTTGDLARSAPAQATTTPPTSTPGAGAPSESGARATTPPGSAPPSSAPAQATTDPPTRTPRADTSTTRAPETADRTTTPPPASTPAQATTPPGDDDTTGAAGAPTPNTVGLPDGATLGLVAAKAGGPMVAPTRAGTASVMRTGGTTVITLPATAGTVGLSRGSTIQLTNASGDPSEFEVQGKRTVDADTAAGLVASGDNRLVLLQSLDDGQVLVVLAS